MNSNLGHSLIFYTDKDRDTLEVKERLSVENKNGDGGGGGDFNGL